jgi:hypothetical protein
VLQWGQVNRKEDKAMKDCIKHILDWQSKGVDIDYAVDIWADRYNLPRRAVASTLLEIGFVSIY